MHNTLRNLQKYIAPYSEHLLDWFHITMRISLQDGLKEELYKQLESIKWNIWHGNVRKVLDKIDSFSEDLYENEIDKSSKRYKFWKYADEFYNYIKSNHHLITNYAEKYKYGETISTSFVESTVNEVISKRMVKKQQMRWTQEGAHRMIQVRISTLNNELKDAFYRWYPNINHSNDTQYLRNLAA